MRRAADRPSVTTASTMGGKFGCCRCSMWDDSRSSMWNMRIRDRWRWMFHVEGRFASYSVEAESSIIPRKSSFLAMTMSVRDCRACSVASSSRVFRARHGSRKCIAIPSFPRSSILRCGCTERSLLAPGSRNDSAVVYAIGLEQTISPWNWSSEANRSPTCARDVRRGERIVEFETTG